MLGCAYLCAVCLSALPSRVHCLQARAQLHALRQVTVTDMFAENAGSVRPLLRQLVRLLAQGGPVQDVVQVGCEGCLASDFGVRSSNVRTSTAPWGAQAHGTLGAQAQAAQRAQKHRGKHMDTQAQAVQWPADGCAAPVCRWLYLSVHVFVRACLCGLAPWQSSLHVAGCAAPGRSVGGTFCRLPCRAVVQGAPLVQWCRVPPGAVVPPGAGCPLVQGAPWWMSGWRVHSARVLVDGYPLPVAAGMVCSVLLHQWFWDGWLLLSC